MTSKSHQGSMRLTLQLQTGFITSNINLNHSKITQIAENSTKKDDRLAKESQNLTLQSKEEHQEPTEPEAPFGIRTGKVK
jgi:hypothetical protein